jgi:hypothetical protein
VRLNRVSDLFIEIAIAVALVTALVAFRFQHPSSDLHWNMIALVGNTALVFGYLITWFRDAWPKPLFWAWLLALLSGHLVVYALVLSRLPDFPLVYYVIANAGELALLAPFLRRRVQS